jgi:hypothetical protein
MIIFICSREKPAGFSLLLFHERGRDIKMHQRTEMQFASAAPLGENVFGAARRPRQTRTIKIKFR